MNEEFEKVWFKILIPGEYDSMDDFDKDRWRGAIRQSFDEGWQACAERKDKVIDQQAKEIEALRGFAKEISKQKNIKFLDLSYFLKFHGLIDETGKPTPLLTGENNDD